MNGSLGKLFNPPLILIVLTFWVALPLRAEDMREVQIQAREAKKVLMQKAAAEKVAAQRAAEKSRIKITADRSSLEKAMAALEAKVRKLEEDVDDLTRAKSHLEEKEKVLNEALAETGGAIKELVGVIRVNAKDVDGLIRQNLQTALHGASDSLFDTVARQSRFPAMDDVRGMVDALFGQIKSCGEVSLRKGTVVDRAGREVEADLLFLGPFTAVYRIGDEVGFCNYAAAGGKLYALSRLPSKRMQKQIRRYMQGRSEAIPLDISRGGGLRQLTHELSLWQQVPKGGPIVWPILFILGVGILIVIERVIFLVRKRLDAEGLIRNIEALSKDNDWQACEQACDRHTMTPVARVIRAGIRCCGMKREEMENALQEAILKEIPPMERFLSTLGMLAAIAPLLGLLGTVTGMIDTFHVITMHGTGDPRLMSGGISEALVTTMLGLSVAIPLMLSQTLLNRTVENRIGEMEEKAVALVNIIHKYRGIS
ncbi:MAG: MotA/TolQ/ExbB proton channel family protein [Desulfobacteraceae bacterium]|jgi:biopolymer transport protein ExbB